jgi:hypothetical protein
MFRRFLDLISYFVIILSLEDSVCLYQGVGFFYLFDISCDVGHGAGMVVVLVKE